MTSIDLETILPCYIIEKFNYEHLFTISVFTIALEYLEKKLYVRSMKQI